MGSLPPSLVKLSVERSRVHSLHHADEARFAPVQPGTMGWRGLGYRWLRPTSLAEYRCPPVFGLESGPMGLGQTLHCWSWDWWGCRVAAGRGHQWETCWPRGCVDRDAGRGWARKPPTGLGCLSQSEDWQRQRNCAQAGRRRGRGGGRINRLLGSACVQALLSAALAAVA